MPAFSNKNENPYNWLLCTQIMKMGIAVDDYSAWKIIKKRYDIFHIHWPEKFLCNPNFLKALIKSLHFLLILMISKIKGTKIVWTIHNLKSHENYYPLFEELFWKFFLPLVDSYISLSEKADSLAKKRFPQLGDKKGFVIPIGHYRNLYPDTLEKKEAREKIGIPLENKLILYFGLIRTYKNVLSLINSFRKIEDKKINLLIVGKPFNQRIKKEVENSSFQDPRIKLILKFVPDNEIEIYMKASDIFVLPQKEIFNSSSIILALSYNLPVLIPEKLTGGEIRKKLSEKWVKTFQELTPQILLEAVEWARTERGDWRIPNDMKWESIAEKTIEVYKKVMG